MQESGLHSTATASLDDRNPSACGHTFRHTNTLHKFPRSNGVYLNSSQFSNICPLLLILTLQHSISHTYTHATITGGLLVMLSRPSCDGRMRESRLMAAVDLHVLSAVLHTGVQLGLGPEESVSLMK